jgi:SAM-dependent methyltransferase
MEVYDEVFVPRLFVPWARLLLDKLELQPGEAVLDVACGPGSATRLAAEAVGPGGRVTGLDLSPAMLAIARTKPVEPGAAPIEYEEAPADRLPVADSGFDVALCQQGLQFFPDRDAALAEMRRALRPDGRVGIAVWTEIEESPLFAALARSIRDVAGEELADRYRDGPWGLTSAARLQELVEGAGFGDVQVTREVLPMVLDGGASQLASTLAASGVAAEIDALPSPEKQRLAEAVARHVADVTVEGELRSVAASHLVLARR